MSAENAWKRHGQLVRQVARSKQGKDLLDSLVSLSGFYKPLSNQDQKKQNDNVAVRDFVVTNIIEPLNKGALNE